MFLHRWHPQIRSDENSREWIHVAYLKEFYTLTDIVFSRKDLKQSRRKFSPNSPSVLLELRVSDAAKDSAGPLVIYFCVRIECRAIAPADNPLKSAVAEAKRVVLNPTLVVAAKVLRLRYSTVGNVPRALRGLWSQIPSQLKELAWSISSRSVNKSPISNNRQHSHCFTLTFNPNQLLSMINDQRSTIHSPLPLSLSTKV